MIARVLRRLLALTACRLDVHSPPPEGFRRIHADEAADSSLLCISACRWCDTRFLAEVLR